MSQDPEEGRIAGETRWESFGKLSGLAIARVKFLENPAYNTSAGTTSLTLWEQ